MAVTEGKRSPQKLTLTERVRHQLEREIQTGFYEPGEHLDETALALRLGCSRTPVREALTQLVAVGLLIRRNHCGVFVNGPDQGHLSQIVEAYLEVEALCASLAISRMSVADRKAVASKAHDPVALLKEIRVGYGNPVIGILAEGLKARLDPFIHFDAEKSAVRAPQVAAELAAALAKGDGHCASNIIRDRMRTMIEAGAKQPFAATTDQL